jgi:hypothetical protein
LSSDIKKITNLKKWNLSPAGGTFLFKAWIKLYGLLIFCTGLSLLMKNHSLTEDKLKEVNDW